MQLNSIETVFENGKFAVHKLDIDGKEIHRTATPSTVALILHDPINDHLALENDFDLSILDKRDVLPEYSDGAETGYDMARKVCTDLDITLKSISYVQSIVCDHKSSGKQVTLMYVVIDSRTVPVDSFFMSTGSELIKKLGKIEPMGAATAIAAHYLKLVRMKKA